MSIRIVDWDALESLSAKADEEAVEGPACAGRRTALTIGVFDGVHRGHQALIAKVAAKAPALIPAAVTFRRSPKGKAAPIIPFEEKTAILESLGIALCAVIDFSPRFGKMKGREFAGVLSRLLRPAYIAVGENFRCGAGRDTDAAAFRSLGAEFGFEVEIVPPLMDGGKIISSSRIREALGAGDAGEAEKLLGRKWLPHQTGFIKEK